MRKTVIVTSYVKRGEVRGESVGGGSFLYGNSMRFLGWRPPFSYLPCDRSKRLWHARFCPHNGSWTAYWCNNKFRSSDYSEALFFPTMVGRIVNTLTFAFVVLAQLLFIYRSPNDWKSLQLRVICLTSHFAFFKCRSVCAVQNRWFDQLCKYSATATFRIWKAC